MPLEQSIILEPYLNDITGSTESSKLKLIAAWDGLSVETQIKIIHAIGNRLPYEIIAKSLDSPNSYIRYLIAKEHYWDSSYEVSSNEDGTIMSQEENEDYNNWMKTNILLESDEWFDTEQEARFAAIGHIDLLENGGG